MKQLLLLTYSLLLILGNATSIYSNTNYDCVVTMDKMLDLYDPSKGWPVQVHNDFNINTPYKMARLGVIGTFNVGKTWLINKLSGYQLPSDTQVHTKGYGFVKKTSDDGTYAHMLLDTEGLNSFVVPKKQEEAGGAIDRRKKMLAELDEVERQEEFRGAFTNNFSDLFIFVTGQMSFNSQVMIQRLTKLANEKNKHLRVVHNLKEWTADEIENKPRFNRKNYAKYLQAIFGLSTVGTRLYNNNAWHYLLAQEGAASKSFNDKRIGEIESSLNIALPSINESLASYFATCTAPLQRAFAPFETGEIKLLPSPKRFVGKKVREHHTTQLLQPEVSYHLAKDTSGLPVFIIAYKQAGLSAASFSNSTQEITRNILDTINDSKTSLTVTIAVVNHPRRKLALVTEGSRFFKQDNPYKTQRKLRIEPGPYNDYTYIDMDTGRVTYENDDFIRFHNGTMYITLPLNQDKEDEIIKAICN